MDYRELRKNEPGACASCRNIRTRIKGETIHDSDVYVDYNGGRIAFCPQKNQEVWMLDTPRMDLAVSDCWEPVIESDGPDEYPGGYSNYGSHRQAHNRRGGCSS